MRLMFTCVLWRLAVEATVISVPEPFGGRRRASVDSCAEIKECPFSGVTKSGRVWRKVPESDAWSVHTTMHQSTVLLHLKPHR